MQKYTFVILDSFEHRLTTLQLSEIRKILCKGNWISRVTGMPLQFIVVVDQARCCNTRDIIQDCVVRNLRRRALFRPILRWCIWWRRIGLSSRVEPLSEFICRQSCRRYHVGNGCKEIGCASGLFGSWGHDPVSVRVSCLHDKIRPIEISVNAPQLYYDTMFNTLSDEQYRQGPGYFSVVSACSRSPESLC